MQTKYEGTGVGMLSKRVLYHVVKQEQKISFQRDSSRTRNTRERKARGCGEKKALHRIIRIYISLSFSAASSSRVPPAVRSGPSRTQNRGTSARTETPSFLHREHNMEKRLGTDSESLPFTFRLFNWSRDRTASIHFHFDARDAREDLHATCSAS